MNIKSPLHEVFGSSQNTGFAWMEEKVTLTAIELWHLPKMTLTLVFLKNPNLKVTFGTDNTIGKLLTTRHEHTTSKYDNSEIYRLTCPTCSMKYTGQT